MRRLSTSVTLVGTAALAMPLSLTAHAHDDVRVRTTTSFEAPLLDLRTPLNADVYHAFLWWTRPGRRSRRSRATTY